MKQIIIMALSALFSLAASAQQLPQDGPTPDDFVILSDVVESGVRTIVVKPAPLICAKQIDIQVDAKSDKLISCNFTGGCRGNLSAINILTKGMSVKEVVSKLYGNPCGNRPTSCTDQLARALKKCYNIK